MNGELCICLQSKHQDNDTYPLTLEEILDETNQMDIGARMKHWLATEVCHQRFCLFSFQLLITNWSFFHMLAFFV